MRASYELSGRKPKKPIASTAGFVAPKPSGTNWQNQPVRGFPSAKKKKATNLGDNTAKENQVSSVSSLRQSIRATLSPPPTTTVRQTSTPMPNTPTSILRKEMTLSAFDKDTSLNMNDLSADDSLLCSPSPFRMRTSTAMLLQQSRTKQQAVSPKVLELCEARVFVAADKKDTTVAVAVQPVLATIHTKTAAAVRPVLETIDIETHTLASAQPVLAVATIAAGVEMGKPSTRTVPKKKQATVTFMDTAKAASPTALEARSGNSMPSPFSPRGNGVCMDLSGMFRTVASSTKDDKQPQQKCVTKLIDSTGAATQPPSIGNRPSVMSKIPRHSLPEKPTCSIPMPSTQSVLNQLPASNLRSVAKTSPSQLNYRIAPKTPYSTHKCTSGDLWSDRQCDLFQEWLNYTLQPENDDDDFGACETKEDQAALRTLLFHQRMAQGRQRGMELFHTEHFKKTREELVAEISSGKISFRQDKELSANLVMRGQVLDLLLSYSTPWLRLALETIFGEAILPACFQLPPPPAVEVKTQLPSRRGSKTASVTKVPLSRTKLALKQFILERVLSDKTILAKYTKRCKVPSGKFGDQYHAELRSVVLYRLLVLFFFLDRAKDTNILTKAPKLFEDHALVKSSRDVLLSFCRDFLCGEGNFLKHLARLGLKVAYIQNPIDELDFSINFLAVDLRDGVKLARMTEILKQLPRTTLLSKLRLPAVSRLQKLHNVGVVLSSISSFNVPSDIASHHIVDGHREMVLKLLWAVVAESCLKTLVDVDALKAETNRIERLNAYRGLLQHSAEHDTLDDLPSVLLRWCQAICSRYGLVITNLASNFCDGKIVCYLIHYYHPTLLRQRDILSTCSDLRQNNASEELLEHARENERANAKLANSSLSELGGIPKIVPLCDSNMPPDERTIVFCLSFMCSRLLESNGEIRACVIIQNCYRRYQCVLDTEKKMAAARIILAVWRERKHAFFQNQRAKYGGAVRVIGSFVFEHFTSLARLKVNRLERERANCAVVILQCMVRRIIAGKKVESLRQVTNAAIVCQATWRMCASRREFLSIVQGRQAARIITQMFRRFLAYQQLRKAAAVELQRVWRGFWAKVLYIIDVQDVISVQSVVRRYQAIRERNLRLNAIRVIQQAVSISCFRARVKQNKVEQMNKACVIIQAHVRRRAQESDFRSKIASAVMCQSLWRKFAAQRLFLMSTSRVVSIQKFVRGSLARAEASHRRNACVRIQSLKRAAVVHRRYGNMRRAAILLQSTWRTASMKKRFNDSLRSIIVCQTVARSYLARAKALARRTAIANNASSKIQALYKCFIKRTQFRLLRQCIIVMQSRFRAIAAVKRFEYLKRVRAARQLEACITLQAAARRLVQAKSFRVGRQSALAIESAWRRYQAKKNFDGSVHKIVACQKYVRESLAKMKAQRIRNARAHSACNIQRLWRGYAAAFDFRMTRANVIIIQSLARRNNALCLCQSRLSAANALQLFARNVLAQRRLKALREAKVSEEKRQFSNALRIQSHYRGYLVRREWAMLASRATLVQRIFRGYWARLNYGMDVADIVLVQSLARCLLARVHVRRWQNAILSLQKAARSILACQSAKKLCAARRRAIREHTAARSIQKTWRCYTVHVDFMLSIYATIDIQAYIRRHQAIQNRYKCLRAADKLLCFARLSLAKIRVARLHICATKIQSFFRRHLVQSDLILQSVAATILQRCTRGYITRLTREIERYSAEEIQRAWRGFVCQKAYFCALHSTIKMQSIFRMALASVRVQRIRRKKQALRMHQNRSAVKIQRVYHVYMLRKLHFMASAIIQRIARRFLSRLAFGRLCVAVVKAQSLARAHQVRLRRSNTLLACGLRITTANIKAERDPSLRLGNRTSQAIQTIKTSTWLREICSAMRTLEMATRHSEVCCRAFVKAEAPVVLFKLVGTCNRSRPHMEIMELALVTMRNVSRYDDLVPSFSTDLWAKVCLDLFQMFRDQKHSVPFLAARLLEKMVFCSKDLQEMFAKSEGLTRLRDVHALAIRKLSPADQSIPLRNRDNAPVRVNPRLATKSTQKRKDENLRKGIRCLDRVIKLVEVV
jgi:abnormal spindle-like microcephaly-associated protein